MRILIADDDAVSRRILQARLVGWGYEVESLSDGLAAWERLREPGSPRLVLLDWMMPGLDGIEVCRRARELSSGRILYILLVTSRGGREDTIDGLGAGADDYVTKPFDPGELRARLSVGERVLALQEDLEARLRELEDAVSRVRHLQGLIPICSYCKKVRDDRNYWQRVEIYVSEHSDARFSHGVCPECYATVVEPGLNTLRSGASSRRSG